MSLVFGLGFMTSVSIAQASDLNTQASDLSNRAPVALDLETNAIQPFSKTEIKQGCKRPLNPMPIF